MVGQCDGVVKRFDRSGEDEVIDRRVCHRSLQRIHNHGNRRGSDVSECRIEVVDGGLLCPQTTH